MKFTKTSTFLFPLLDIPKEIFKCEIKNSFGRITHSNRFINSYLYNEDIITDSCIHLLIESFQDKTYDEFYSTMVSLENYVDDYEKNGYSVMIYNIPDANIEDFNLLISGAYSKVSDTTKSKIFKNSFYSDKPMVLPMIFSKAIALKETWENELSNPHPDPVINYIADLGDQEVWSVLDPEKETLNDSVFEKLLKKESVLKK